MIGWIQRLSDRGELILINAICFGGFIGISLLLFALHPRALPMTTFRAARLVITEMLLGAAAIAILRARGWRQRRLGLAPSWSYTFAGVALFLTWMFAWTILARALCTIPLFAAVLTSAPRMTNAGWWPAVLLVVLINPVYEETFVAAYNIQATTRYGPGFAIATSTIVRVLYHLYQGPSAVISIGFFGAVAAAVYWRWRSAWPLIVMHAITDALALLR